MASLVESGKHGSINTTDTTTNGFYVIIFASETYTLQDNTTIDEQIYCALTTNYPAVIICSSIVVLSCSVYASDVNMIT